MVSFPVTFLRQAESSLKVSHFSLYFPFLASAISLRFPPTLRLLQWHQKWEHCALNPRGRYQPHIFQFFPPRMAINVTDLGCRVKTHFPVEITLCIPSVSVSYFSYAADSGNRAMALCCFLSGHFFQPLYLHCNREHHPAVAVLDGMIDQCF